MKHLRWYDYITVNLFWLASTSATMRWAPSLCRTWWMLSCGARSRTLRWV